MNISKKKNETKRQVWFCNTKSKNYFSFYRESLEEFSFLFFLACDAVMHVSTITPSSEEKKKKKRQNKQGSLWDVFTSAVDEKGSHSHSWEHQSYERNLNKEK